MSWVLKPTFFQVSIYSCNSHPMRSKPLSVMVLTVLMMLESTIPSLDSNSRLHKQERLTGGDAFVQHSFISVLTAFLFNVYSPNAEQTPQSCITFTAKEKWNAEWQLSLNRSDLVVFLFLFICHSGSSISVCCSIMTDHVLLACLTTADSKSKSRMKLFGFVLLSYWLF